MKTGTSFATLLIAAFLHVSCGSNCSSPLAPQPTALEVKAPEDAKATDPTSLANEVGAEFEVLGRTASGAKGAPVFLLEERHDSRAAQIEHAITLVRLHEKHSVNDVELEGYLKDGPPIDTGWVSRAAHTQDSLTRARVFSRLLREREISSAEFVKLVFDNVQLHPAEARQQYDVNVSAAAATGPLLYLPKLVQDEWTQQQITAYQDQATVMSMRGEQHLAVAQEIERRAQAQNVRLTPSARNAWNQYVAFWQGRVGASNTMVTVASGVADQPNVHAVPIVIGAFHTQEMADELASDGRPLAVLTPAAIKSGDKRGDLADQAFELKYAQKSVFSTGLGGTLVAIFPRRADSRAKKPQPVINEPWIQAKSEIYFLTSRLVHEVAETTPPPPIEAAPYGLSGDDFRASWTSIDLTRVEKLSERGGHSIVFPMQVKGERRCTVLWIKAALQTGQSQGATIEEILRSELDEVQAEGERMRPSEQDELGRIRMGTDVIAVIAKSREGARKAVLSNS